MAARAGTTGTNERDGDAIAYFPVFNALAHLADDPCKFMSWNMGKYNIGIMPNPSMPITSANPRGFHFKENALLGRIWVGYLGDLWGLTKGFKD
jgi:hypothetical protein